ncbi:hypothetical protein JOE27_003950 [Pseudomonas sp. M5]|nr:hypothetical protein [Pseudomonas sp. M5]
MTSARKAFGANTPWFLTRTHTPKGFDDDFPKKGGLTAQEKGRILIPNWEEKYDVCDSLDVKS